ncbi:hypothetical protein B0H13DRAFT_1874240 [Mycena leptocephala]|nr:hypothetical protein B0H13DRAFT_1874240 [Mycena leptocephala]
MYVRDKSFKVETIKQAWFKSGINLDASGKFPRLTPDIFTAADYAPSISTSTELHLPSGFPTIASPADPAADPSSSTPSPPADASSQPLPAFSPPSLSYDYPSDDNEPPSDLTGPGLQKLNAKGKKRAGNERTLSTTARILTSTEGRALAEEKRAAQVEKKAKDDENRAHRLLADAEVIKRRTDLGREGIVFSGNIKSLKAPQLKDLAWSLELEENGTRDVLIDLILSHFDLPENQPLKEDKRYVDLWNRRRRRVAGSDTPEQSQDALTDSRNVASSAGSSNQPDFDMRPPPPPNAPYQFPDTWMPPQPHVRYRYPIDHPPPFSPAFYSHTPSQLPARPPSFSPHFYQHSDSPARHFYDPSQDSQSFP